jgi:hypothetical protein
MSLFTVRDDDKIDWWFIFVLFCLMQHGCKLADIEKKNHTLEKKIVRIEAIKEATP